MPIETASCSYIAQLHPEWPSASERISPSPGHFLVLKRAWVNTFPNVNSEVSCVPSEFNGLIGLSSNFQTQLNARAASVLTLSAGIRTNLTALSASSNAQLLGVSATAMSMASWEGLNHFWGSATPAAAIGDLWFET
jgi:hypothetical protein